MALKMWAKTAKELDFEYEGDQPQDRKECFEEYEKIEEGKTAKGEKLFIGTRADGSKVTYLHWVTYPNDEYPVLPDRLSRAGKRKYEVYVGGFLDFYDSAMKPFLLEYAEKMQLKPDFQTELNSFLGKLKLSEGPHSIYFEWGKDKGKLKSVSIYMSPAPGNPDPRTPKAPPPPDS